MFTGSIAAASFLFGVSSVWDFLIKKFKRETTEIEYLNSSNETDLTSRLSFLRINPLRYSVIFFLMAVLLLLVYFIKCLEILIYFAWILIFFGILALIIGIFLQIFISE
jgi:hypothetical protein